MVTRETDVAATLASAALPNDPDVVSRLVRIAAVLADDGIREGFLGPNEADRIWERHIYECAAIVPLVTGGDVVDVGSGAGLPGLVLASFGIDVTVVDAIAKRCRFIEQIATTLELPIRTIHGRAEDVARETTLRDAFHSATARALAPPPVALELCAPFVQPGGAVVLMAESHDGLAGPADQLGCGRPEARELAVPGGGLDRYVIIVEKIRPTPDRFPRRAGLPARRPLG